MIIELWVVQFWSEIILTLVISNRTRAARSFDFEITHVISDQIALHSVHLPLLISCKGKLESLLHNFDQYDCNDFFPFASIKASRTATVFCANNH